MHMPISQILSLGLEVKRLLQGLTARKQKPLGLDRHLFASKSLVLNWEQFHPPGDI